MLTCCQPARMGSRMYKQGNEHIDDCLIMLEYRKVFGIQQGCLKGKLMMGMKEGNSSVLSYADALMYYDVETIHHGWIDSTFEKNNR